VAWSEQCCSFRIQVVHACGKGSFAIAYAPDKRELKAKQYSGKTSACGRARDPLHAHGEHHE